MSATATRTLQILGVGFLAYYLFQNLSNKVAEGIEVQSVRVKVEQFSLAQMNVKLRLFFDVLNVSGVNVPFNRFVGALYYGAMKVADIDKDGNTVLPNGTVTTVNMLANVDLLQLGTDAVALVQSGQFLQSLTVQGDLFLGGDLSLRVNYPLQIN